MRPVADIPVQAPADLEDVACGLEAPAFRADQTNNNCFWHFFSYEHWRRQVVFSEVGSLEFQEIYSDNFSGISLHAPTATPPKGNAASKVAAHLSTFTLFPLEADLIC